MSDGVSPSSPHEKTTMSAISVTYALAGSWVNLLFYGTEVVLAGFFFHRCKPSGFFLWILVGSLAIDTVCTGLVCYNVYYELAVNSEALSSFQQYWTLPATILCTYHAAMLEQIFFIHRYWQITHNKIVTGIILTPLIAHMVFAWVLSIHLFLSPLVTPFSLNLTIVAATLCAATDTFIALVTFHTMRTIKTTYSTTQNLLHRISIQSVICGFTTAICTIIMLSLLVTHNLNPFTLVYDILGRVYTLTILVNYMVLKKPMIRASTTREELSISVPAPRASLAFASMNMPQTFTVPVELSTITHELTPFGDTHEDDSTSSSSQFRTKSSGK